MTVLLQSLGERFAGTEVQVLSPDSPLPLHAIVLPRGEEEAVLCPRHLLGERVQTTRPALTSRANALAVRVRRHVDRRGGPTGGGAQFFAVRAVDLSDRRELRSWFINPKGRVHTLTARRGAAKTSVLTLLGEREHRDVKRRRTYTRRVEDWVLDIFEALCDELDVEDEVARRKSQPALLLPGQPGFAAAAARVVTPSQNGNGRRAAARAPLATRLLDLIEVSSDDDALLDLLAEVDELERRRP